MNTLPPLNSSDFIWPKVRDKWVALDDLFVYSKVTGPHTERLKVWRDSWTADEKLTLIKYYSVLRIKTPDMEVVHRLKARLFKLFSEYFPHVEAERLEDFFCHQSYLMLGILEVIEDSWSTHPIDVEKLFVKHSQTYVHLKSRTEDHLTTTTSPRAGLFFIIERIAKDLADNIIDFQVKSRVSFIMKNECYRLKQYLSQGIWSHQKLFESRSLGPDETPKKKNKKRGKPQEFIPKKKLPPSWMIAAYIHGLYSATHFSWKEQKVTKQNLKTNVGKVLNKYILEHQKTVVQHFKRLIYALYADKISTEMLESAGLGGDISVSRGLLEPDLDLLQNFYVKWKSFTRFDDLGLSGDKLICHKIRVYLQYHGFEVSLSKAQVLSVVSKAIKNLPSMGFSLSDLPEWQENSFVQGLSQAAAGGWTAIKKYGPVAVKIAIFAAILLEGEESPNISEVDDMPDFYNQLLGASECSEGVSTPALEGAAQGKVGPSEQKKAKEIPTIDEMIAEHFSVYVLAMVEDYLKNDQAEIIIPLATKFPWLQQIKGALTDTWDEYYYRLIPESGMQTEINEKSDTERLNTLAEILQVQPSWVISLLESFGVEIKDLEAAHQKALNRYLTRPMTHRIMMGQFFAWRDKAQACWNILGNDYMEEWKKGQLPPLALPHIAKNNPAYSDMLQKLIRFVESQRIFKARDCFRKYFSPWLGSMLVEAAPQMMRVNHDENWLEFALAFDCEEFVQSLITKKLDYYSTPPRLLATIRVLDDTRPTKEDFRSLFFLALKYDKNSTHLAEIKEAMRAYSATDISFEQIILLAENTTADQFANIFHILLFGSYSRAQLKEISFNPQIANSFFEKLGSLSPRSRDNAKIDALIMYARPISLVALKSLIKYTSDKVLEKFFQQNLIDPRVWHLGEPVEHTLEKLALSAYNYGLIETAKRLIQLTDSHRMIAANKALEYWQIFHIIYSPSSLGIERTLRSEDFADYDMASLSLTELKALLMHSARRALVPLAYTIMQQNKFQQEKPILGEYCQLLKNLKIATASPRSKLEYLELILKDMPSQELSQLYVQSYSRKIFLVDFLLEIHEQSRAKDIPHWQRASAIKADLLMGRLLKAILPTSFPQASSRNISRGLSFASAVSDNKILSHILGDLLSLDVLEKLIKKRWYHAINVLMPYHRRMVVKEQWLPLYESLESTAMRKTDYYRSFEDYMIYLIKNKVLHDNSYKAADIIYQYWKKVGYSPSKKFVHELLKPVSDVNNLLQVYDFDEKQKTHWMKIVLKLSYMCDKNPRRRRIFWTSIESEQVESVVIHRTRLVDWMKKVPYSEIVQPYIRKNHNTPFGLQLRRHFPLELENFGIASQIPRYFNQGYRLLMMRPGDLVAGYHIMLIRAYLLDCFREQLLNPALAVRSEAKQKMALLMKAWLNYYGTDLHKVRAALHRITQSPVLATPQYFTFNSSERYWELFEMNAYALIESGLVFEDEAENLRHLLKERQGRISGYRLYFDSDRVERLQAESQIEWKAYLHGHQDLNVNPIRPKIPVLPKALIFSAQNSEQIEQQEDEQLSNIDYFEPSAPKKSILLF